MRSRTRRARCTTISRRTMLRHAPRMMASWCMAASRCETLDDLAACGDLSQRTAVSWRATASRPIALDAPALESTTSSTRTCARAQVKAACTLALDARERNATTLIRTHAYTHERLNACEPCALAAPRALRLGGALCLAPCALAVSYALTPRRRSAHGVLAACASAALRTWRLSGASRFASRQRLSPWRHLLPYASTASCGSCLGGASHLAPRRRFAPCVSTALARPAFSRFRRILTNLVYRPIAPRRRCDDLSALQ